MSNPREIPMNIPQIKRANENPSNDKWINEIRNLTQPGSVPKK
jgi:hypothetical protein